MAQKKPYAFNDVDYDPLLLSQFFDRPIIKEPETPDGRIAWRLLARNVCDAALGQRRHRLRYITSIELWMSAKDAPYSFSWWCECLQLDDGYVRRIMTKFLKEQRLAAMSGKRTIKSIPNRERKSDG